MAEFTLSILAAEKTFFEGPCVSIIIPTTQGQYGILAHHSNMIAAVVPGILKYTTPDGSQMVAAASAGLVKVEGNHVLLLLDTVEKPDEIDENRAKRAAEQAKEAILQKKSILDYYSAQAKMARAINRLKVKRFGIQ